MPINQYDDKNKPVPRQMFGRKVIYTSKTEITMENIAEVLEDAMQTHEKNADDTRYLWNYYKGKQPILYREKAVRPEICHKVVENHANEAVSFYEGYICGEPIQYVPRSEVEETGSKISSLNEMMFAEDKAPQDQEIVEWGLVCGTAYRMVLPDTAYESETDESPFEMYTLDPRFTFVVYSAGIGHKPMMAGTYYKDGDYKKYTIYTEDLCYRMTDMVVDYVEPNPLGMIPIIEYPANKARLGVFEVVLPLLDTINDIESNRMDGVEQTVQAFIKFINCDITAEDFEALREMGAIKVSSTEGKQADVDVVTNELNQSQTQTLKDDCYDAFLTITGMPNRNGGSSTSDTGSAVLLRDGWASAEARAKAYEHMFKRSEKNMLKIVLKILRDAAGVDLMLKDIDMKFTRRNYENIQSKAQVLVSMLQQPKIAPLLAFEHCGMFSDPESAYQMSNAYYEESLAKWNPIEEVTDDEDGVTDESVSEDR